MWAGTAERVYESVLVVVLVSMGCARFHSLALLMAVWITSEGVRALFSKIILFLAVHRLQQIHRKTGDVTLLGGIQCSLIPAAKASFNDVNWSNATIQRNGASIQTSLTNLQ